MREETPAAELEQRLVELRRTNEELGQALVAARAGTHPATAGTAGRAVSKLRDEREAALAESEARGHEIARLRHENGDLRAEVERLRTGPLGFLRRLVARAMRG